MPWQERLREAAYTGPDGTRQRFAYEDVQTSIPLRRAAFEFVGLDGALVQHNGLGPRRYPLRVFCYGADCDQEAEAFEALLLQPGTGKLEHPVYGTHDVVPFGTITRRDDLKTAGNQAVLQVVFLQVLAETFPSQTEHLPSAIDASVQQHNADAVASYADSAANAPPSPGAVRSALRSIRRALGQLAESTEAGQRAFAARDAEIQGAIDLLIATPLDLAQGLITLAQSPARSAALVRARLDAYGNLLQSTIERASRSGPSLLPERQRLAEAEFRLGDFLAGVAVTGAIIAATDPSAGFVTRAQALETAESVAALAETWIGWREELSRTLGVRDDGVVQQHIQRAVPLVQRHLRELSFGLLTERSILLDRDRTLLDLAAELFGDVSSERLDYLLENNALSGDQILELQRGTVIRYDA